MIRTWSPRRRWTTPCFLQTNNATRWGDSKISVESQIHYSCDLENSLLFQNAVEAESARHPPVFSSISQSPTTFSLLSFSPFGDGDINVVGNSGANNLHINDVSTNQNLAYFSAVRYIGICAFASGVWWPFPEYVRHDADERRAGHASDGECNFVTFQLQICFL